MFRPSPSRRRPSASGARHETNISDLAITASLSTLRAEAFRSDNEREEQTGHEPAPPWSRARREALLPVLLQPVLFASSGSWKTMPTSADHLTRAASSCEKAAKLTAGREGHGREHREDQLIRDFVARNIRTYSCLARAHWLHHACRPVLSDGYGLGGSAVLLYAMFQIGGSSPARPASWVSPVDELKNRS